MISCSDIQVVTTRLTVHIHPVEDISDGHTGSGWIQLPLDGVVGQRIVALLNVVFHPLVGTDLCSIGEVLHKLGVAVVVHKNVSVDVDVHRNAILKDVSGHERREAVGRVFRRTAWAGVRHKTAHCLC